MECVMCSYSVCLFVCSMEAILFPYTLSKGGISESKRRCISEYKKGIKFQRIRKITF